MQARATYHPDGNRATKTTAYGTITYTYDSENRLVKTCGNTGVGVEYQYDSNGNLLSQTSSLKHSIYEYSPQTVRFTTIDPIRDGANWFTYVNNDPVNYIDLWGLLWELV